MDETAVHQNPSERLVIGETGKATSKVGTNDKENQTVLFTVNADGDVCVPLALWAYARYTKKILDKKPPFLR